MAPSHWCFLPPRFARWARPPSGLSAIAPLSGVGGPLPLHAWFSHPADASLLKCCAPASAAAPAGVLFISYSSVGLCPPPLSPPLGALPPVPRWGRSAPRPLRASRLLGGKPPNPKAFTGGCSTPVLVLTVSGYAPNPSFIAYGLHGVHPFGRFRFFSYLCTMLWKLLLIYILAWIVYIIHKWLWRRMRP